MKNNAVLCGLLLVACVASACGDDEGNAEFASKGSGEVNGSPLWPLTAGSRWTNEPSQVGDLFVYAVEPGTAEGRVRLVSQDVVADLRLRDDGVYYGGSSATGWLDEPVLFLPDEVREGMRWSDGGFEFEVLERIAVQADQRVEVTWAVSGPSFVTGESIVRRFVEGGGIYETVPPDAATVHSETEFQRVVVTERPVESLPEHAPLTAESVRNTAGLELEWRGEAITMTAVEREDGFVVSVSTERDDGDVFAAFEWEGAGVVVGDVQTRPWQRPVELDRSGVGAWVDMRGRDRSASHLFSIHDVEDEGLHMVDPTWGHRWRPVHWLTAFRNGAAFVSGDVEPVDSDAVDMVFQSWDGLWTWGSNDADIDDVGALMGAKYGTPSVRDGIARDTVVVDPDGHAFRIPVSGELGRIEYLGRVALPSGYRAAAGVLLGPDPTAPATGDTLLVAAVHASDAGLRTSMWQTALERPPADVTHLYPGLSVGFLFEDALVCWPTRLAGEGGVVEIDPRSVTLDVGQASQVLVEDLGFAHCATVVRGGEDGNHLASRLRMDVPGFGRVLAVGPPLDMNPAGALMQMLPGSGDSPIVAMQEDGVERIWAADIVHSAAGVPLHDASGPGQSSRVPRAAPIEYAFAPDGAGMLIHRTAGFFQEFFDGATGDTVRFREHAYPLRAGGQITDLPIHPAGGGASFVASVFDDGPDRRWERLDANGRTPLEGLEFERGPLPATQDGTRCVERGETTVECVAPDGTSTEYELAFAGGLERFALPDQVIWRSFHAPHRRVLLAPQTGEVLEVCAAAQEGVSTFRLDAQGHVWRREGAGLVELTPMGCFRYDNVEPDGRDGPITDHYVPLAVTFVFFREVFSTHPVAAGVGVSAMNQQMIRVPRPAGVPFGPE